MKVKNILIKGTVWTYRLYTEKGFIKKHPDSTDSAALALCATKELHFTRNQRDIGTVRHEVRHAFIAELCLECADLSLHQFEEINCTFDQHHWDDMDKVSKKIFENLAD